ncbi:MAG: hypothetical protein C0P72_008235 [Clostridia bacterium]
MSKNNNSKTIVRTIKNRNNPYVVINKSIFNDKRLSWKAKGLMGYFLSKPDDWKITISDLIKQSKDGRDSVYSGLAELKKYGYLQEVAYRQGKRIVRREYKVYEAPEFNPYPKEYWGKVVHELLPNEDVDPENPDKEESLDPDFPDQENHDQENPTQLNNDHTNNRNKHMNGWMGAPRLSIQDVEKSLDEEAKEDPILKALYDGIKFVDITGDENNRVDRAEFAAEFYMVLHKHFRNRMHPEIIRIAFRLYNEKQYSNDGRKSIDYIANPAGWFYQCYDEAIHIYKQIRYTRSVEEKNQREDELIRKAIYASRVGYI